MPFIDGCGYIPIHKEKEVKKMEKADSNIIAWGIIKAGIAMFLITMPLSVVIAMSIAWAMF